MKANKVLKRLGKIETLLLGVAKRCSRSAAPIKQALQDAKAAFAAAKSAVSSQVTAEAKKNSLKKKAAVKKKVVKAIAVKAVKKTRKVSAATREKQAERMKALWAEKKKARAESALAASAPRDRIPGATETGEQSAVQRPVTALPDSNVF